MEYNKKLYLDIRNTYKELKPRHCYSNMSEFGYIRNTYKELKLPNKLSGFPYFL